jgi:hypothetical protein
VPIFAAQQQKNILIIIPEYQQSGVASSHSNRNIDFKNERLRDFLKLPPQGALEGILILSVNPVPCKKERRN